MNGDKNRDFHEKNTSSTFINFERPPGVHSLTSTARIFPRRSDD